VIQQGQVFKLAAKDADGQPLWAYRYRLEGQSSARPQVGGFASRAEAQKALRKALDRIGTKTRLSTQSRYSIRSSGRCTLGGRRTDTARTRLAAASRRPIGDILTGAWTFGGRRGLFLSPRPTTEGANQQELPEAL
jgi:hypothetical protein